MDKEKQITYVAITIGILLIIALGVNGEFSEDEMNYLSFCSDYEVVNVSIDYIEAEYHGEKHYFDPDHYNKSYLSKHMEVIGSGKANKQRLVCA